MLEHASSQYPDDTDGNLAALQQNPEAFQWVPEALRGNKDIVLEVISKNGLMLKHASWQCRGDRAVVDAAVRNNPEAFQWASYDIVHAVVREDGLMLEHSSLQCRRDFGIFYAAVWQNAAAFQWASEDLRGNKDIVLKVVSQNGLMLEHASSQCRGDRAVVDAAVRNNFAAFLWASRNIVLAVVCENGLMLEHASSQCRHDFDVVRAAVWQNAAAIQWASEDLRGNDDIVFEVVRRNGLMLEHASSHCRDNRAIVGAAVHDNAAAFQWASENLRGNMDIVLAAVCKHGLVLEHASSQCRGDWAVVDAAVRNNPEAFRWASKDVVLEVLRSNGLLLEHASSQCRGDFDVVHVAVLQNVAAFQWASEDLRGNKDRVLEVVRENGLVLEHASSHCRGDRAVVDAALGNNPAAFRWASEGIVLEVVRENGLMLEYAAPRFRADHDVLSAAIVQHASAFSYMSQELRSDAEFVASAIRLNPEVRQVIARSASRRPSNLGTACAGAGNAFHKLNEDYRAVEVVEWRTVPLRALAGLVGVCHSVLLLGVAGAEGFEYAIEKSAIDRSSSQETGRQFQNGVHVSFARDVEHHLSSRVVEMQRGLHIAPEVMLVDVWRAAVGTGPYDVSFSNCHHAALAGFNRCVHCAQQVHRMPNQLHVIASRIIQAAGFNICRSNLNSCEVESGSGEHRFSRVSSGDPGWAEVMPASDPYQLQQENEQLRVALMTVPAIEQPPSAMNAEVAQMVLDDLWQYSISGIEQHRPGHIVAIGPGAELLEQGTVRGLNHWDKQPRMRLADPKARNAFKKFMIQDGIQIVEASDGSLIANDFFASSISPTATSGGSGAAAAQHLSMVPGSIVFKVSTDGGLKEFRGGELWREHCNSRQPP